MAKNKVAAEIISEGKNPSQLANCPARVYRCIFLHEKTG